MDYRHHATDIIAGSLLGLLIGWFCYRQYFPAIDSPVSNKPYSPRVPRGEDDDADDAELRAGEVRGLRSDEGRTDGGVLPLVSSVSHTNGGKARNHVGGAGGGLTNGRSDASDAQRTVPTENGREVDVADRI